MISAKHLKKGDDFPTIPNDDKLRLLSMRFCPYAQRIHLILDAKKIPYHTVNIDLKQKPEWLTKYSPLGKVPALGLPSEPNTPYIFESLVVADYLDEKFPQRQLYPTAPLAKAQDRLWIERFNEIIKSFYRAAVSGPEGKPTPGSLTELAAGLDLFETELQRRGTVFFGGAAPGMLDYMIWPWCERITLLKHMVGDQYEMDKERYPKLLPWFKTMIEDPAVQLSYLNDEIHYKFVQGHKAGTPDYDMLLKIKSSL